MQTCPFFGRCGGCKYDFAAPDYREKKSSGLHAPVTCDNAVWLDAGLRRRGDFCFAPGNFGFFESRSKNIVNVTHCPNMVPAINHILPDVARMPWGAAGSCLITACDNGIDIAITSRVPYFSPEFRAAAMKLDAIRVTWNGAVIKQTATPTVTFDGKTVEYPTAAFLQPTIPGADIIRRMVLDAAAGYNRIADLFCGLGNFTFALNADGFDIAGTGTKRDLFTHPLTPGMLAGYDCVVMDPPRAGADVQSQILAHSAVRRIIYVSCNPQTWRRDAATLTSGGYKSTHACAIDQFVGSNHWEIFSVFDK